MIDHLIALEARDDLLWIAAHWNDLRGRLRPGGGNALTGIAVMTSGHPLPIDLHVSDLMAEIEWRVARHYANVLIDAAVGDDEPITTSHMPLLLTQVAQRYGHFTAGDDDRMGIDFCDDANDYRDRVRKVLERPAPPAYVGPCQHMGEDGAGCPGELYVREGRDGGACKECGTEFTLAGQREYLMTALEDRLMTPSEIVTALKVLDKAVPPGTVKSWIHRKRLVAAVEDAGLYRLADAKRLAEGRRVA